MERAPSSWGTAALWLQTGVTLLNVLRGETGRLGSIRLQGGASLYNVVDENKIRALNSPCPGSVLHVKFEPGDSIKEG